MMFDRFPRLMGTQNRMCMSKKEMMDVLREWASIQKSCEVGLYSFEEWLDGDPIKESVIVDLVMFHGSEVRLRELGMKFKTEGKKGYLIDDGNKIFLVVEIDLPLFAPVEGFPDIEIEQNIMARIIWPGCRNLKTGKTSKFLEKYIP